MNSDLAKLVTRLSTSMYYALLLYPDIQSMRLAPGGLVTKLSAQVFTILGGCKFWRYLENGQRLSLTLKPNKQNRVQFQTEVHKFLGSSVCAESFVVSAPGFNYWVQNRQLCKSFDLNAAIHDDCRFYFKDAILKRGSVPNLINILRS